MFPVALLIVSNLPVLPTLAELETTYKQYSLAPNFDPTKLTEVNSSVIALLDTSAITTPSEFFRASNLISSFRNSFDTSRIRHELCLCALAGGESGARAQIKFTWDQFIMSTGRDQRIGTMIPNGKSTLSAPDAPKSVVTVMKDPDKALVLASKTKNDDEITKICADDQAVRQADWSKMTTKQMEDLAKGDSARLSRTKKLLEVGRIVTGEDFDHASLVLQHGSNWKDYSLAHELSICSLLLKNKDKNSAWLSAATYDRMLGSGGYHQRFGTQYGSIGKGGFTLDMVDTTGISDSERKMIHCPTLEEAKNRKWD